MKFPHFLAVSALSVVFCAPAFAWLPQGHSMIARAAVESLGPQMPTWFVAGEAQIAHDAQDPDIQKNRDLPLMTEAEAPQHYIDLELLQNRELPKTRKEFYALCRELEIEPENVGELPYALAEWTQRLTMDFAEARRFPENRFIQTKTLVTAGILAHYAGDATMPLHVTVHHDGRVDANGKSPKSGIHLKVDSLIEKVALANGELTQNQKIEPLDDLWQGIGDELKSTSSQIDRTYELENQLPPDPNSNFDANKEIWTPSPEIRAFTLERGREATRFCAQLFLTAWQNSAKIKLPVWLKREN